MTLRAGLLGLLLCASAAGQLAPGYYYIQDGCGGLEVRPSLGGTRFYPRINDWVGLRLRFTRVAAYPGTIVILYGSVGLRALDLTPFGMPGCELNVFPDASTAPRIMPDYTYEYTERQFVPNEPSLAWQEIHVQFIVYPYPVNPVGVGLSDTLKLVFGV